MIIETYSREGNERGLDGPRGKKDGRGKWWSTSTVNVALKLKRSLQCTVCASYIESTMY